MSSLPRVSTGEEGTESCHLPRRLTLASPSSSRIRVGVIGYGYWGPQGVRNFHNRETSEVLAVCDSSPQSVQRAQQAYPEIRVTQNSDELLRSRRIDAIAVVT